VAAVLASLTFAGDHTRRWHALYRTRHGEPVARAPEPLAAETEPDDGCARRQPNLTTRPPERDRAGSLGLVIIVCVDPI